MMCEIPEMPDEVYVRTTTKKGLSAVRPESPLAITHHPVSKKLSRTRYLRADKSDEKPPVIEGLGDCLAYMDKALDLGVPHKPKLARIIVEAARAYHKLSENNND